MTYRLPTEAEWEKAYRAGTTTKWFWGDDPEGGHDYAWYGIKTMVSPPPVATKKPNPWGLHDMAGGIWEWCADLVVAGGSNRALRGGSWGNLAAYCRAAYRGGDSPGNTNRNFGFRLARSTPPQEDSFWHFVKIADDCWMAKTVVTQGQWQNVMGSLPNIREEWRHEDKPVVNVSWNDCRDFIERLNETEHIGFDEHLDDLPLETDAREAMRNQAQDAVERISGNMGDRLRYSSELEFAKGVLKLLKERDLQTTIRPEILAFAEAMETKMAMHDYELGCSWKGRGPRFFQDSMEHVLEYAESQNDVERAREAIEIGALAMMYWWTARQPNERETQP